MATKREGYERVNSCKVKKRKDRKNMATIGSKRMQHFSTGIFTELNEKRDAMEKQGKKLYNLFVGTPDFPPAPRITTFWPYWQSFAV